MTTAWRPRNQITGAILAGGRGTRMGGCDKGLVNLAGEPLVAHVLARLRPQVGAVVIVANRNLPSYRRQRAAVIRDEPPSGAGPLAGIASALHYAATAYLLIVPCDNPLLPADLAVRLRRALADPAIEIAVAQSGERLEPLFALLRTTLAPSLRQFLAGGGHAVHAWYAQHRVAPIDFSDCKEAFVNLNTPADHAMLLRRFPLSTGAVAWSSRIA